MFKKRVNAHLWRLVLINLVALSIFVLTSCAEAINVESSALAEPYGFFSGLLHGFVTPWAFLVSLFADHLSIYGCNNVGGWYDLGFILGFGLINGASSYRYYKWYFSNVETL